MMSRCFIWFLISGFKSTQYITEFGGFYKNWRFYLEGVRMWRISGASHWR